MNEKLKGIVDKCTEDSLNNLEKQAKIMQEEFKEK